MTPKQLILFCCLLMHVGCSAKEPIVTAIGPINGHMVNSVKEQIGQLDARDEQKGATLLISYSPGGRADALFSLHELVESDVSSILLSGDCLSACAELLAMSGLPVKAVRKPVIGYHVGPAVVRELILNSELDISAFQCINERAERYTQILKRHGLDAREIARIIINKLKFKSVQEAPSSLGDDCSNVRFTSENRLWFPTRSQLKNTFGISIDGEICADSVECMSKFALERWGTTSGVLVGDEILP